MSDSSNSIPLKPALVAITHLRNLLANIRNRDAIDATVGAISQFVGDAAELQSELQRVRELVSPVRFGSIGITLGRSDSIAKFFAFSFVNVPKCSLAELDGAPFFGSGVYAIYYHGKAEACYQPLSGTETPIYVGKANPKSAYAETVEAQGQTLYLRMKEHAKAIRQTGLPLSDFSFRSAAIQSGMQAAVEEFMIRLFKPIWNKETNLCFGIGKHGDSATTRTNKRSPWDTMHPGRKWAADTADDQRKRSDIESAILKHFEAVPVIADKDRLFQLLALG